MKKVSARVYESLLERCQTENKDIQRRRQIALGSIFVFVPSAPNVIKICCAEKIDEKEAAMVCGEANSYA
jgi:hypothetical protein